MLARVSLLASVAVTVAALAGCGGSSSSGSGDQSSRIEHDIMTTGSSQLQASASDYGVTDVRFDDAGCVEQGSSQSYQCLAHYTADGQSYKLSISASCDSTGKCVWQSDGAGFPE